MTIHMKYKQAGFTLIEVIVTFVVTAIIASLVYTYFSNALTRSGAPVTRLRQASELHQVMENIVADFNWLNKINLRFKWRSGHAYQTGDIVLPSDDTDNITSNIANNARYYVCTIGGTSGNALPSWQDWSTETRRMTTLGRTVTDGPVTWTEQGYVWKEDTEYPNNAIIVPAENNGHYYKGGGGGVTPSGTTDPNDPPADTWTTISGDTEDDGALTWTEAGTILDSADVTDNLKNYLTTDPGRYDDDSNSYTVVDAKFIQFNGTVEVDAGTSGTSSESNLLKVTIQSNTTGETLMQLFTIR